MAIQKRLRLVTSSPLWYFITAACVVVAGLCMWRGFGKLYWGPAESDLINSFYPYRVFVQRWVTRGVFPFWDPHIFSGYPTLETQQMLNLNPLHLLTIWLKPEVGLIAFTGINTIVASIGMAWALRQYGRCSPVAAALGAGLYTFGALFSVRVMAGHLTVVSALAWWPVAALSVLRIVRRLSARGAVAGASGLNRELAVLRSTLQYLVKTHNMRVAVAVSILAHGMVCLAGAPQYMVYLFYVDVAVALAAARRWTWLSSFAVLALIWVLALLLSTPQWLPAFWYLPYTARALSSGGMTGITFQGLFNIGLETLMPFPFGDDINRGHLHFKNVWETALYPGMIAVLLGTAAVLQTIMWRMFAAFERSSKSPTVTPLVAAGVLVFLFGCYMMIGGWLPGFGGFREPQKARALLAFGFALMTAGLLDVIVRRPKVYRLTMWISLIGTASVLVFAARYTNADNFRAVITSFGYPMDPQATAYYNSVLKNPLPAARAYSIALAWAAVSLVILGATLLLMTRRQFWLLALVFIVALADPFVSHVPAWVARHPWKDAGIPQPIASFIKPRLEVNAGQLPWRVILHSAIINRTHHMDGFYEFHGYDPLMPAFAVGRMLVKGVKDLPEEQRKVMRPNLLERIGVRYDTSAWRGITPLEPATSASLIQSPGATLYAITRRAKAGTPGPNIFGPDLEGYHYVMPGVPALELSEPPNLSNEFQQTIEKLAADSGQPRRLADGINRTVSDELQPGESIAHLETKRPDEFGVKVKLLSPALLVYKGTWLPGWQVLLNGTDVGQALMANNWMCAAIVPAGEHEVVFQYRPVGWGPSLAMSGAGLLVIAAGVGLRRRRRLSSVN